MTELLYYAYWNGEELRNVFEGAAGIFSLTSFSHLVAFAVLLGLVIVVAAGAVKGEGKPTITFIASAILLWFVLFVPKASVVITDVRSEEVYVVDNVPLGIAFPASVVNRVGYWLATTYETAYSPVEVARFTKFGAVYPERVLEVLAATGPVDASVRALSEAVLEACVIPEAALSDAKTQALVNSADLWTTLTAEGWVNPARRAALPDGRVVTCPVALQELQTAFEETELPTLRRVLGAKLAPDSADPAAILSRVIPEAEALLYGLSRSMDTSLRQSVLIGAIPEAARRFTARSNAPEALAVALSKAQGNLASEINYRTMASIAKDSLPKIRNALEFVVIALFPVLALLVLAGASKSAILLRGYFSLLFTVELWPAVASVVNHLIVSTDTGPFGALAREFGGNSIASLALIRETGATSQAIAGGLMCMVPMIAYALVRAGDVAATTLVSGLMAPARSAASAQGAGLAAGNIQQGNVRLANTSVNTVRANKSDRATESVSSDILKTTSAYGSVTRDDEGAVTGLTRTPVAFGMTQSATENYSRQTSNAVTTRRTNAATQSSRYIIADAAMSADASERGFASALRDAISEGRTLSSDFTHANTSLTNISYATESGISRSNRVSEGSAVKSDAGFGFNASVNAFSQTPFGTVPAGTSLQSPVEGSSLTVANPSLVGGNAGGNSLTQGASKSSKITNLLGSTRLGSNVSFNEVQDLIDTATSSSSTRSGKERQEAYGELTRAAESVANTHSDEGVRSAARRFLRTITATDIASEESAQSVTSSVDATGALTEGRAATTQTSVDRSVAAMQGAITHYGTPEATLRAAYNGDLERTAGNLQTETQDTVDTNHAFGPGRMSSAKSRVADVYESSDAFLSEGKTQNQKQLTKEIETLPTAVTPNEMRFPKERGDFNASFEEARALGTFSREGRANDATFERGLLLLTREAYRRENADKNYAVRNAFFFGLGYESPTEISSGIREKATKDPELTNLISKIGSQNQNEVSASDWDALLGRTKK